ncbi:hypothetical protein MPER_12158 [Moniliophthora perniciosa FA553]|nr:hypothetical protein MPER_12158 [Moniliophthora perniciosa FA553]
MVILPSPEHFVVVQLDPVDSVAHLDNPELTEACRRLTNKKYLAFVADRAGLFWPDIPYYGYTFYFVHQGLKYKDEDQQPIDPAMCTPVLPNTSHPFGRAPLDPGQPLPWNDCYISSTFSTFARSRTFVLEKDPPMRLCLSIDDAVRWYGYTVVDDRNLSEQLTPLEQQVPPTSSKDLDVGSHDDEVSDGEGSDSEGSDDEGSDNGAQEHEGWNPTREKEQFTRLEEVIEELEEIDAELLEEAVFRTSFDLTELDQVNDPAELMKEVRAFEELRDELVKGEKQRKIESARRIDDEHFAKLSSTQSHTLHK